MSDDDTAGPSLLLAQHEKAHREHLQQHQHSHHRLHRKQEVADVVTEVVATISILQKIDVDINGNTITIQTILADSTGNELPGLLTTASSTATPDFASPPTTYPESQPSSTVSDSSSLLSRSGASSVLTSTPSIPTSLIPTSFASFIASSNSTTLISSSSSLQSPYFNSSISSTSSSSRSSLSYLRFTGSTSSEDPSTSTSSLYSPSSSAYLAIGTDVGGGGAVLTAASDPAATGSKGAQNGGDSDSPATPTPVVIGSVVGSVAGVAVIIMALLWVLRWRKRNQRISLGSGAAGADTIREGPTTQPPSGMSERRSLAYAVPAALATLTGYKNKRISEKTERTISSTAGSERGFVRVSGRKLPSVLQNGGDGYGGGIPDANTLSGSSFYRDSQGFYGGPGGPSSPPIGITMQRDSGIPIMRPSPARTPVTEHPPYLEPSADPLPPRRPDVLGRSHPSQDGSHTSKFTEEV